MIVQHTTSDQYLTSGKVSTRSIHGFKRYRLLKTLIKNFNILSKADADANADADADAVVTAIALPVLTHRRANDNGNKPFLKLVVGPIKILWAALQVHEVLNVVFVEVSSSSNSTTTPLINSSSSSGGSLAVVAVAVVIMVVVIVIDSN